MSTTFYMAPTCFGVISPSLGSLHHTTIFGKRRAYVNVYCDLFHCCMI